MASVYLRCERPSENAKTSLLATLIGTGAWLLGVSAQIWRLIQNAGFFRNYKCHGVRINVPRNQRRNIGHA